MFVKLRRNKSGNFSAQVVESIRVIGRKNPQSRVLKTFGTAISPEEINSLKNKAHAYIASLPLSSKKSAQGELTIRHGMDIESHTSFIAGFHQVFSGLYHQIFAGIGLQQAGSKMLRDLAILRIADPRSKRGTAAISSEFGLDLNVDRIYKCMDRINAEVIQNIRKQAFANTCHLLKNADQEMDVLFYDLTTLYFETNSQDVLRDFGFSKDGKSQHVQIMMAIITTRSGLPVDYELFKGNAYEGHTLIPAVKALKEKYNISKVVLVADSGLISKKNTDEIKALGMDYIIGGRVKSSSQAVKKEILETGYVDITDGIKCKIIHKPIDAKKIAADEGEEAASSRMLIYYSQERAKKDAHEREKAVRKIMKNVGQEVKDKLTGIYRKPYVKLSGSSVIGVDEQKLKEAEKLDGYFMLETNRMQDSMLEVLNHYRGLWQIEQTFRISKHNLKIRPVFHYNTERIQAHIVICYVALVLVRTLEYQTKRTNCYIPLEECNELLKRVRISKIVSYGKTYEIAQDFPEELKNIYACVKAKIPRRFIAINA